MLSHRRFTISENSEERLKSAIIANLCNGKVLQVYCGAGKQTAVLACHVPLVVGIDNDPRVTTSQYYIQEYHLDNVHFIRGDARCLDFHSNSFDTVVLTDVLEYEKEADDVLAEAFRVCKNKGRIIVSVHNDEVDRKDKPMNANPPWLDTRDSLEIRAYTRDSLEILLSQYSGSIKWIETVPSQWLLAYLNCSKPKYSSTKTQLSENRTENWERTNNQLADQSEKVSVIIPTYNRAHWVTGAIESVLQQSYKNLEIVVVDDGSTDNTEQVLDKYKGKITYIYQENSGNVAIPVNVGLEHCTGKYICRLDDDDFYVLKKIELQVRLFQRNPDLGLVYSNAYTIDHNLNPVAIGGVPDAENLVKTLLTKNHICHSSVMVRRKCFEELGGYDESLKGSEDYDLWIRIASKWKCGVIDLPLVKYRIHSMMRSSVGESERLSRHQKILRRALATIPIEDMFPRIKQEKEKGKKQELTFWSLVERSHTLLLKEMYQEAERDIIEATQLNPTSEVATYYLCLIYKLQKRYEEAIPILEQLTANNPLYEEAVNLLGAIYAESGQYQKAIMTFKRSINLNPENGLTSYNLATWYAKMGKLQISNSEYRRFAWTIISKTLQTQGMNSILRPVIGNLIMFPLIEELYTYLGCEISEVEEYLQKNTQQQSPLLSEDILASPRRSEDHIFNVIQWYRIEEIQQWIRELVNFCIGKKFRKILNYGCGIGEEGIALTEVGVKVTLVELPSSTFDFIKWRFAQRGLKAKFIDVKRDMLPQESYDCILLQENLEHPIPLEDTIKRLSWHLSRGGFLLIFLSSDQDHKAPTHLAENQQYKGKQLMQLTAGLGFTFVGAASGQMVFQKE